MANIRKETGRHDWVAQKCGIRGKHVVKEMWLCRNCQLRHDEERFGPPPPTGCVYDVKMVNLGKSRMDDMEEYMLRGSGDFVNPGVIHRA